MVIAQPSRNGEMLWKAMTALRSACFTLRQPWLSIQYNYWFKAYSLLTDNENYYYNTEQRGPLFCHSITTVNQLRDSNGIGDFLTRLLEILSTQTNAFNYLSVQTCFVTEGLKMLSILNTIILLTECPQTMRPFHSSATYTWRNARSLFVVQRAMIIEESFAIHGYKGIWEDLHNAFDDYCKRNGVARKYTYGFREQEKFRSACISAKSDPGFSFSHGPSMDPG